MSHPLCRHTVTIYNFDGRQWQRLVAEGCFCSWHDRLKQDITGQGSARAFFLVLPGQLGEIAPGDWVCEGIGPENKSPLAISGAEQVKWVKPMRDPGIFGPGGRLLHTEAGND